MKMFTFAFICDHEPCVEQYVRETEEEAIAQYFKDNDFEPVADFEQWSRDSDVNLFTFDLSEMWILEACLEKINKSGARLVLNSVTNKVGVSRWK